MLFTPSESVFLKFMLSARILSCKQQILPTLHRKEMCLNNLCSSRNWQQGWKLDLEALQPAITHLSMLEDYTYKKQKLNKTTIVWHRYQCALLVALIWHWSLLLALETLMPDLQFCLYHLSSCVSRIQLEICGTLKKIFLINKTRSQFFERVNKIGKPLTRLTKKKTEDPNTKNKKWKRRNHKKIPRKYKNHKRILWTIICQQMGKSRRNGQVSRTYSPPKLNQGEIISKGQSVEVKYTL